MLGKHHSHLSYGALGREFDANESILYNKGGVFKQKRDFVKLHVDGKMNVLWPEAPGKLTLCSTSEQQFGVC